MSPGPEMFYDSLLEALRDDVNAIGGPKAVGEMFWPEKSVETRRNAVNDRLNSEKRDRFSDDQRHHIMRLAVECRGFSAAAYFTCDTVGLERPQPRRPADERAKALKTVNDASTNLKRALEVLERLGLPASSGSSSA